jgi:hypothetical protein
MHKAIVVRVDAIEQIPNANTIQIAYVVGERVIVGKSTNVGDVGVFFMPDLQLSEQFCSENNLYRHSFLNKDQTKTGFFEDNRRVRAQPFMKIRSEGFFVPFEYFEYTGYDIQNLSIGDQFDELNGLPICCKYISPKTARAMANGSTKQAKKKLVPDFKEHKDTEHFKYHVDHIPVGSMISIQAKRHGTSGRYGYMKVYNELSWMKKLINKIVPVFPEYKWDYVVGTRRCVLQSHQADKEGFHGSESFRFEILEQLKPYLSKGMTIYGEIIGYANGTSIMPSHKTDALKDKKFSKKYGEQIVYKYGCIPGTYRFVVYRISLTTEGEETIDFSQTQLVDWCRKRGLEPALDVCTPFIYDGDKERLMHTVDQLTERYDVLTEDFTDPSHVSEGVIVRIDHCDQVPRFYKSKSFAFKVMEGIAKEEEVDLEDAA